MKEQRNNIAAPNTSPSSLQSRVPTAVKPAELVREEPSPQAKLRRYEYALVVLGTGILVFGAWTILKIILAIVLQDEAAQRAFLRIDDSEPMIIYYVGLAIAFCFDLLLRFYVFRSARKESFGGKPRYGYLVWAGLLLLGNLTTIVLSVPTLATPDQNFFDTLVTLVIEITSMSILIMLIYSSIQVKSLRKEAG